LLNLANPDKEIREKSIDNLAKELERADLLNIKYVVFHPGAHLGEGILAGIKRIGQSLNEVFKRSKSQNSILLVETTAGEGSVLGYCFEQLRDVIDLSKNSLRMGVCFDTCHVFSAGYDIRTEESFMKVLGEFDKIIGLKNVNLFHLNDSKRDLGERMDSMKKLDKGKIGISSFQISC